jgi:hypothetical protein
MTTFGPIASVLAAPAAYRGCEPWVPEPAYALWIILLLVALGLAARLWVQPGVPRRLTLFLAGIVAWATWGIAATILILFITYWPAGALFGTRYSGPELADLVTIGVWTGLFLAISAAVIECRPMRRHLAVLGGRMGRVRRIAMFSSQGVVGYCLIPTILLALLWLAYLNGVSCPDPY